MCLVELKCVSMWFILLNIAFATAALAGNNIVDGGGTAEPFEMDDTYFMETVRMIRSIYIEVISNIPFSFHRALVDLQRLNGVKIGNYDDSYNAQQAMEMAECISREMHDIVVRQIVSTNTPISMIVDSVIDVGRKDYIAVYFQAIENNTPTIYFYKLIEVTDMSEPNDQFNVLIKAIKDEPVDLLGHLKSRLVGFSSDAAPVMTNKENGFSAQLNRFTQRPLYTIHCMAHRLHLASIPAFERNAYFVKMDQLIYAIYEFFVQNAQFTNRQRTRQFVSEFIDDHIYAFNERWNLSELSILTRISNYWPVLVESLDYISEDETFDEETRNKAKELNQKLKGENFLLILNFVIDVLEHLKFWSDQLQSRLGLLMDYSSFNKKMILTFETLKINNGKSIIRFLDAMKCSDIDCISAGKSVHYHNVELLDDHAQFDVPLIIDVRESFLTKMIEEISSYFPAEDLQNFIIFNPKNIPTDLAETLSYGTREIDAFCAYFSWQGCEQKLEIEWNSLLHSIGESAVFIELKNTTATNYEFWTRLLNAEDVTWTPLTQELIHTILVLPIGSADIEQGFRIVNDIRSEWESSKHLEDFTRMRFNVRDNIENIKAEKYAKVWIKNQIEKEINIQDFDEIYMNEQLI